jgi:hypothetical protein
MNVAFVLTLLAATTAPAPDTLVVCPAEFRAALAPWEHLRRGQGHQFAVIAPPETADGLATAIRDVAGLGRLKFVLLIGDVDGISSVPIGYVEARINVRWGSEPRIATDQPLADLDGDRSPDVAVGRIPADSPAELAAVVRKIIRYEHEADHGFWRRRVNVVAGVGGFGPLADVLVETAGRRVIDARVPAGYDVVPTLASPTSACCPPPGEFTAHVSRQLSGGSLAWIYLGHGLPTALDAVDTPAGPRPILAVDDVPHLRCGAASPLAVLIACYTGAIDAPADCLAEELVTSEHGPVAVIAATRVTMPYGNAVFGHELLRACFADRPATLGELWTLAGQRTMADAPDDPLRASLDALARGLSPPPVDLAAERREHVMMYQLLGDPLVRLQLPRELRLETSSEAAAGAMLTVAGQCDLPGMCVLELVACGRAGEGIVVARMSQPVDRGPFRAELPLPADATGQYTVRAFVIGHGASAAGATSVTIRSRQAAQIASAPDGRTVK